MSLHRYWGSHRLALEDVSSGFLVAGLSKLWAANRRETGILTTVGQRVAGIVFDEAHQAVAETYRFVVDQLAVSNPPLLGLTATPGRTWRVSNQDFDLADVFNENKVTIDPRGHDSPVTYLIANNYLAQPSFVYVRPDPSVILREPLLAEVDYREGDLNELGYSESWTSKIVDLVANASQRHRRILVFCPSVRSAHWAADESRSRGIHSEVVDANTPAEQRATTIESFRAEAHTPMVVFNFGVLTAGFDAPKTSCVIIARPTRSLVLYSQMVGRAMRGPRSGGNRRCEILTIVDPSMQGFGSVVEAFENWEEIWRPQTSN